MAIEITVPRLGWSMEEGLFAGWLKHDGEWVRAGDPLFALEGDKATQEIESLDDGILRLLPDGPRPGDTVMVGQVLAHLVGQEESTPDIGAGSDSAPQVAPPAIEDRPCESPTHTASVPIATTPTRGDRPSASPRARRRAAELGVDWTRLTGSGRSGRIRERDVLAAVTGGPPPRPDRGRDRDREEHGDESPAVRPISAVRRTIAERMAESHRTTAPVTLTTTADATNLVNLRSQFRASASSPVAAVPSYNDFLIKLTAIALRSHPEFNSRWEDAGIVVLPEIHIALAVDTDAGLLAPVIRQVDRISLRGLAAQTLRLVERARAGILDPEEMRGGTFTVTNLGPYGIDSFTPIINPPQCAILGVGRIREQPVFMNGQFVPRDLLTLSLTFDHRIADGGPAARFLQTLVKAIEAPAERLID